MSTIGHNRDPLMDAEDLLAAGVVDNDEALSINDSAVKALKDHKKGLVAERKQEVEPLNTAWKAACSKWDDQIKPVDEAIKSLTKRGEAYKLAVAQALEEERRKAAIAARKAEQTVKIAELQGDQAIAEQAKGEAAHAHILNREIAKVTPKGLRTVTKHEVKDGKALLAWIIANDRAAVKLFLLEYAKKHHKNEAMDGVRVWQEKEVF